MCSAILAVVFVWVGCVPLVRGEALTLAAQLERVSGARLAVVRETPRGGWL